MTLDTDASNLVQAAITVPKKFYSTKQAAKRIGIGWQTLLRWMAKGIVKAPEVSVVAGVKARLWTDADIERIKQRVPKLRYKSRNGRRSR